MRNINRIVPLLKLIEDIWKKNPDLRLTQLIGNCYSLDDLYYVEDNDLEIKLKECYGFGVENE